MRNHGAALAFAILFGWLPVALVIWEPPPLIGDEAYYARVPFEMKERGDWLVPYFNGEPRYKKPPLQYWLVAASYALFGENERAARLPSLLAVFLTAGLLLWFGKQIGDEWTGALAATAFLLNPMTVLLGNWGAPEATLTLFITTATLAAWQAFHATHHAWRWAMVSGIVMGLGILTKGAPGLVLPLLIAAPLVWSLFRQQKMEVLKPIALWLITFIIVAAPWFIAVGVREGEAFWKIFFWREHIQRVSTPMEGHKGPFWFYLPVIWLAFFPWSVRLPMAVMKACRVQGAGYEVNVDRWMAWWAFVVVAVFSVVATKLPHYIFPAFPAIAWLSARQWQRQATKGELISIALLSLPVAAFIFTGIMTMSNAYLDLLKRTGFMLGEEHDWLQATVSLLTGGFSIASVATLVAAALFPLTSKRKGWLIGANALGAAVVTAATLFSAFGLLHASGGHEVAFEWRQTPALATFGSDTEWAVFYARRPVPMFGDELTLRRFLRTHPDAAVVARLDYAPKLRACGLKLQRFGIWVVGRK